ncbi:MAG: hypothetical protein FWD31_16010, partial [Planctomycetaceae bacterium]|nr:hypothetical protein [Planctomycetaceae bacterium]
SRRGGDGYFESRLSDSAVSTAVACVALEVAAGRNAPVADTGHYADQIAAAKTWLLTHQNADGLYGDSPESPANLTATFLAYVALSRDGQYESELAKARAWLREQFSASSARNKAFTFASVRRGFLAAYGKDLTFSVPILALATAAGFFENADEAWRAMPQFPFEAVLVPESLFKYLNLPVVSYAIPALICVGLAQLRHRKSGVVKTLRSLAKAKALRVLLAKQPASGGFLEAAPLTGFCALCLCAAGMRDHPATHAALRFLLETQRDNGAWPIDRDLRQWVTSLALVALTPDLNDGEKQHYRNALKRHQTQTVHPFTRSAPGGWGWTTHSGSVPDADDTSAALIALHHLGEPATSIAVQRGIEWLLNLQNVAGRIAPFPRDGGMPTFCRGWGRLPFDRSCPDISAHAYKAFSCFENDLPQPLQKRVVRAKLRILRYLHHVQRDDGAFLPLWFGDQDAESKEAPVYGSAVVLEHLQGFGLGTSDFRNESGQSSRKPDMQKTVAFLLAAQHPTGGWGSCETERDDVTVTARCVAALKPYPEAQVAIERARNFLQPSIEHPETIPPEPIGLYFAHLWYSEELYGPVFLLSALSRSR